MQSSANPGSLSRRQLLGMIGATAGSARHVPGDEQSRLCGGVALPGPIDLQGAPRGASVLILGAGIAGMTAAYELRNAGYQVQVLEYNGRAGGRNWTLARRRYLYRARRR